MRSKGNAKGLSMNDGDGKAGASPAPEPISGNLGAAIIGPTNPARAAESRSSLAPSPTDHGTLASLKWSFADCRNRLQPSEWARQTTGRELHVAQAFTTASTRKPCV